MTNTSDVKGALVQAGKIDSARPQALVYNHTADGRRAVSKSATQTVTGQGYRVRHQAEAMVTVRPATVADAPAMGQLVVRAWQAAYRGQMPDDYLNGLRAGERAAYWDGVLRREDRRGVIVVAERDGVVVGFAAAGPSPDPQGAGELYAINIDPDHWGSGAGRALLRAAEARLDRMGFAESVLWVLAGNARARGFYERAGWAADGTERTSEAFGVSFDEVRYRRRSTSEAISDRSAGLVPRRRIGRCRPQRSNGAAGAGP